MRKEDIRIRDPFILPYDGKYYLYGTGCPNTEDINCGRQFWCYVSEDLEDWSDPICCFNAPADFWGEREFWAPEVHYYNGKFYMLATFMAEGKNRASQALVAEHPWGPFRAFGKPLTPADCMCLDGTLYVEDGIPYLVYCHEWVQIVDGEICVVRLKEDLSESIGDPIVLFRASESGWAEEIYGEDLRGTVTDGPFLVRNGDKLMMFWSSFYKEKYAVGVAISESGNLLGPWKHDCKPIFSEDGGHGMLFQAFDGRLYFSLHRPNDYPNERPCFIEMEIQNGMFSHK